MPFLDLTSFGYAATPADLYALWLTQMQAAYPGYVPQPGSLESVQAQSIAALASDVAQAGVVVPDAIFRQFGAKLFSIPFHYGTAATAVISVTAVDTVGHTLPGSTSVSLGAYGFVTQSDLVIPAGSSRGQVTVVANQADASANGAADPVEILASGVTYDWIASATVVTAATGGVDPEDDVAYENRLVSAFRLIAPRPITASDYAAMALSFQPAAGTTQQIVGRATAIDGYSPTSATFTVTTTSGSPTLTITTAPGTGILPAQGSTITGTGIPANTIVLSASGTTITMSNNATASASGITATVGGTVGNARTVTIGVTDANGLALSTVTKTALTTWFASLREANFVVNVIDPTYTAIYTTSSVHLYPGFDPTATAQAVQAAQIALLSPQNFGLPPYGDIAAWLQSSTIRYDKLISAIQAVPGVDYLVNGSLKIGTAASPTGVADLTIGGPIALPTSTTSTVALPTVA